MMKHSQHIKSWLLTYCGFCTLSILVCMPNSAWAIPISAIDPVVTDSYRSGFLYGAGTDPFESVEAFIISDTGSSGFFEDPGIDYFEDATLTSGVPGSVINNSYALATGVGSTGSGVLLMSFTGDPIGTMVIDILTWSGAVGSSTLGNLTGTFTFIDGVLDVDSVVLGSLSCGVFDDCHNRAVPEPMVLGLLSIGLVGVGAATRKRSKKR
jgi:hypothetical protein